jgi:hypothetical protein
VWWALRTYAPLLHAYADRTRMVPPKALAAEASPLVAFLADR